MGYYTIQNNGLLIAENEKALTRFYDNVKELPQDYEQGKYIIGEVEEEIDVPDYEQTTEPLLDAEGNEVLDENNEPIISTVQVQLETTHKETIKVQDLVLNPNWEAETFAKIKAEKLAEASQKAKQTIEKGYIEFQDAKIETNAQTVGDLTATMLLMQAGGLDTYSWLSMDDVELELSVNDIAAVGSLIAAYKNEIWNTKYLGFVEQINNAETLKDLKAIKIEYQEAILWK